VGAPTGGPSYPARFLRLPNGPALYRGGEGMRMMAKPHESHKRDWHIPYECPNRRTRKGHGKEGEELREHIALERRSDR